MTPSYVSLHACFWLQNVSLSVCCHLAFWCCSALTNKPKYCGLHWFCSFRGRVVKFYSCHRLRTYLTTQEPGYKHVRLRQSRVSGSHWSTFWAGGTDNIWSNMTSRCWMWQTMCFVYTLKQDFTKERFFPHCSVVLWKGWRRPKAEPQMKYAVGKKSWNASFFPLSAPDTCSPLCRSIDAISEGEVIAPGQEGMFFSSLPATAFELRLLSDQFLDGACSSRPAWLRLKKEECHRGNSKFLICTFSPHLLLVQGFYWKHLPTVGEHPQHRHISFLPLPGTNSSL